MRCQEASRKRPESSRQKPQPHSWSAHPDLLVTHHLLAKYPCVTRNSNSSRSPSLPSPKRQWVGAKLLHLPHIGRGLCPFSAEGTLVCRWVSVSQLLTQGTAAACTSRDGHKTHHVLHAGLGGRFLGGFTVWAADMLSSHLYVLI